MRKLFLALISCTLIGGGLSAAAQKPNVVIFYADDFGWGDLRLHNSNPAHYRYTPNMDRIFTEGIELSNYMTHAVCSPSRAGLLTGKHYAEVGAGPATDGTLPNNIQNFAKDFKAAGYTTGAFGKWHNGMPNFPADGNGINVSWSAVGTYSVLHGENTLNLTNNIFENHKGWPWGEGANAYGFDRWVGYYNGGSDLFDRYVDWHHDVDWWHDREYHGDETGYTVDLITLYATQFIETNQAVPFVCYIPQEAVHNPIQLKQSDLQEFCGLLDTELGITGQWDYVKAIQSPSTSNRIENVAELRFDTGKEFDLSVLDPGKTHLQPLIYAAYIYALDKSIGTVIQKVVDIGQFANTVFVFASDNGATPNGINTPFQGGKHTLWDGGVHVPAAIWWPGTFDKNTAPYTPASNEYRGFIGYTDIYPTLMAMTEQPLLGTNLNGKNCWAYLQTRTECRPDLTDAMFWMWSDYGSTRTERWKLFYSESKNQIDLYDLYADIGETTDVQAAHPVERNQLIELYKQWLTTNSYAMSYVAIDGSDIDYPNPAPSGEVLEIKATQTAAISSPDLNGVFVRFSGGTGWDDDYQANVHPGDRVEFDIYVCEDSAITKGCFYAPGRCWIPFYKSNNGINQDGILLPDLNLPKGVWVRQVVGVGNLCPAMIPINYIALRSTSAGYYHYYMDNIVIRKNDGTIRSVIWQSSSNFASLLYRYKNVNYNSLTAAKAVSGFPFSEIQITATNTNLDLAIEQQVQLSPYNGTQPNTIDLWHMDAASEQDNTGATAGKLNLTGNTSGGFVAEGRFGTGLENTTGSEWTEVNGTTASDDVYFPTGDNPSITVEFWVKNNIAGGTSVILDNQFLGGYQFQKLADDKVRFIVRSRANIDYPIDSISSIGTNEWHHVAGTWHALTETLTLYIDGVEEGSTNLAGFVLEDAVGSAPITMLNNWGHNRGFNGVLDEVRISDAAYIFTPRSVVKPNGLIDRTDESGATITAQYTDSPSGSSPAHVFDNEVNTKYITTHSSSWVQHQFGHGHKYKVVWYSVTSAMDAPAISSSNLILNPSMEAGVFSPDNWILGGSGSWSTAEAQDGSHSLQVSNYIPQTTRQTVPIEIGKKYDLSVWINTTGLTTGNVVFDTTDKYDDPPDRCQFPVRENNGKWTEYSSSFTATNTSVQLRMYTTSSFSGTAWFDHVSLKTSPPDAETMDPAGWTLSGSNDGSNWTVIDRRSGVIFTGREQTLEFNALGNGTAYEYYRFDATNNSGAILQFAEVQLFSDVSESSVDPYNAIWTTVVPGNLGTAYSEDFDGDGRNNLYEYALNGNPENSLDEGTDPNFIRAGGTYEYIYLKRNDDSSLIYTVESTTNLVSGIWTGAVYTVVRTNVIGGAYNEVINEVPMDDPNRFIRLKIELL